MADLPDDAGATARLLGRWRLLRADPSLEFAAQIRMEFRPGGRLLYELQISEAPQRWQSVSLIYRVEGDILHTDNPAASHEIFTRFRFGPGDVLVFDFAGALAWFVREM